MPGSGSERKPTSRDGLCRCEIHVNSAKMKKPPADLTAQKTARKLDELVHIMDKIERGVFVRESTETILRHSPDHPRSGSCDGLAITLEQFSNNPNIIPENRQLSA
jgi:hypothetical protein